MLYAFLCYNNEATVYSWTKEEDDAVMAKLDVVHQKLVKEGRFGPALRLMPTTTGRHAAQGEGSRARRPLRRDERGTARLLRHRLRQPRSRARRSRASSPPPTLAAPTRCGPCACSCRVSREWARRDRRRLDRRGAHRGTAAGGGGAAALFPRSRHRRGGLPGGLPCVRSKTWPRNGPAARSRRLAHLRRPQRGDRQRARARAPGAAARGGADLRPRGRRSRHRREHRPGPLQRRRAAAPVRVLPSRAARDPADRARPARRLRAVGEADRARVPRQRGGDGAAHHARQAPHRRAPTCPSRRRARSSGRSGSRRSRR